MNPEIKELWVEALESGKYEQGKKVLHNKDNNTFCCLGVLCDLAVKAGLDIEVGERPDTTVDVNDDGGVFGTVTVYGPQYTVLPSQVQEWAGINTDVGDFKVDEAKGTTDCLTRLNDSGTTFEGIAKIIKEKF